MSRIAAQFAGWILFGEACMQRQRQRPRHITFFSEAPISPSVARPYRALSKSSKGQEEGMDSVPVRAYPHFGAQISIPLRSSDAATQCTAMFWVQVGRPLTAALFGTTGSRSVALIGTAQMTPR